jgi:hypothetical protein
LTAANRVELTVRQLDQIAWRFLRSEFTGQDYANWPIDRRIDTYLLHHGLNDIINDGSTYNALLDHVMARIGPALRNGVLAQQRT